MKILIDENIPYAEQFFAGFGEVGRFPGRELTPEQLVDVDVLLVRSITKVNAELLAHANKLKFVGTATIGEDHIDKPLLAEKGIAFSSCPGCNAVSVAEYVVSALLVLSEKYHFDFRQKTVAIVGVGNIGKAVKPVLEISGCELLLVDPIRQQNEPENAEQFIELNTALSQADIVCFHTPLTRDGDHPTFHLLNEDNLPLLKDDVCLLNACRGEVIDNQALLAHIKQRETENKQAIKLVLDVWEGEPNPLQELIPYTDIASAHIAGYSLEGKARGTEMLYQAVCKLLGVAADKNLTEFLPQPAVGKITIQSYEQKLDELKRLVHLVYDVRRDDALFRNLLNEQSFDWLRKNYPLRREWSSLQVEIENKSSRSQQLRELGFAF